MEAALGSSSGDGGAADVSPAHSLRSVQRLLWDVLSERLREAERDEVLHWNSRDSAAHTKLPWCSS